jgi:predicted dinucleotide-binding enzyme
MMELYHGTTSSHLESIIRDGLVAGQNLTEARKKNTDVVFLTTNYISALGYAGRAKKACGGDRIVISVATSGAKPWKRRDDCSIFVAKNIPSNEIVGIEYPDK